LREQTGRANLIGDSGAAMIDWIVGILMMIGGFIADWIIAPDNPNFELVQAAIGTIVLAAFIALIAFSPKIWRR
jgi:hypothetical protein